MRRNSERTDRVEVRTMAARRDGRLSTTIEEATHALDVTQPGGDPERVARNGARGDEVHRFAIPIPNERVLQHRDAVGRHPAWFGTEIEQRAHLVGLHADVPAE